jgi:hypothetical protein
MLFASWLAGWGTSNLQFLDLAQNQLGGSLPDGWLDSATSYMQLQYINLAENMLTGSIPAGVVLDVQSAACCNREHRCA